MNVRESPLEIDPLVLPMFNVYKGGELSECIAVKEELGMNFEVGDLEWLLENHGVLDVTSKSDMPTGGRSDMSASTIGDEIVLVGGCAGKQTYQDWGGYACETITNETIVYSTLTDT